VNSKILIAFTAGAIIASGIVYVAVRPEDAAPLPPPVVVRPEAPAPVTIAQVDAPPTNVPPPAVEGPQTKPPETAHASAPAPTPVREKPSPLRPPPVRRESPVIIARREQPVHYQQPLHQQPPQETAPSPMPVQLPDPPPATVMAWPAPAPRQEPPAPPPAPAPPARTPNTVILQPGTILAVKIGETISSVRNQAGNSFAATLERPLVIDGFVIAERGAHVEGRVVAAQHSGNFDGPSQLGVEIIEIATSDGQRIHVRTATFRKGNGTSYGGDLANVVLTRGKPAEIPAETRMSFRVQDPISITERLQ
jgi:hypothetical protein